MLTKQDFLKNSSITTWLNKKSQNGSVAKVGYLTLCCWEAAIYTCEMYNTFIKRPLTKSWVFVEENECQDDEDDDDDVHWCFFMARKSQKNCLIADSS